MSATSNQRTPATVAVARMGVGSVVLVAWTVGTRGLGVLTGISATQAAWHRTRSRSNCCAAP